MQTKINLFLINYNYGGFVHAALSEWQATSSALGGIIVVDDQSTEFLSELENARAMFPHEYCRTNGAKSRHNAINQLNAIKVGLSLKEIQKEEFYWFVDADDVPIPNSVEKIMNILHKNPDFDLFCFSRINAQNQIVTPQLKHPLWISNAPTSSLIIKGSSLLNYYNQIFWTSSFRDTWFDIRLTSNVPTPKTLVSSIPIFEKREHKTNDSNRYQNDRILKTKRMAVALFYFLTVSCFGIIFRLRARKFG